MLSQTAEYALRAMVCLAAADRSLTTAEIAEQTKVPRNYLSKLMQSLRKTEFIHAQRGVGGGFTMARPAADLTVLEVIDAIDPIKRITQCPLGLDEHKTGLCAMHKCLDDAAASMQKTFTDMTIAHLADQQKSGSPLCPIPQ